MDYCLARCHNNALCVLRALCSPLIASVTTQLPKQAEGIPEVAAEAFGKLFADIETAFQKIFDSIAATSSAAAESKSTDSKQSAAAAVATPRSERLDGKQWVKELSAWRTTLTPYFGPIFSDPLRALNRLVATQHGASGAAEEEDDSAAAKAAAKDDSIKADIAKEKQKRALQKEKAAAKKQTGGGGEPVVKKQRKTK